MGRRQHRVTQHRLRPEQRGHRAYSFAAGVDAAAHRHRQHGVRLQRAGQRQLQHGVRHHARSRSGLVLARPPARQTTAGGYGTTAMGLYAEADRPRTPASFVFGDASTGWRVGTPGRQPHRDRTSSSARTPPAASTSFAQLPRRRRWVYPACPGVRPALERAAPWISGSDVNAKENFRDARRRRRAGQDRRLPVRGVELQGPGRGDPPHGPDGAGLPRGVRPGRRPACASAPSTPTAWRWPRSERSKPGRGETERAAHPRGTTSCARGWRGSKHCSTSAEDADAAPIRCSPLLVVVARVADRAGGARRSRSAPSAGNCSRSATW